MRFSLRRRLRLAGSMLAVVGCSAALLLAPPLPDSLSHPRNLVSQRLVDRHGQPLREILSRPDGVSQWVKLDAISHYLVAATLCSEDQRFWHHHGLDLLAIVRAARANFGRGRVVEGASTVTQQLVRDLLGPASTGRWRAKLEEAYWACRFELVTSKPVILEDYLNRIPYGSQCYGCESASRFYFARSAGQLSLAQAAFLAILPRAPESFAPYQQLEDVLPWQRLLLRRMRDQGQVTAEQERLAESEPIVLQASAEQSQAGHFCDVVARQGYRKAVVTTTVDLGLQHEVEQILAAHVHALSHQGVTNGAVVVLDVENGEVLALAGSLNYAEAGGGQFDAALAGRQPGSTLKPFTYSLGLERKLTAASVLPDLDLYPHQVEKGFIPRNYDDKFHGPVRLREALACSYNVPVVRVLEDVGTDALLRRLRLLGCSHLTETPAHYGLGLTLGDGEVSLLELTRAYRTLARFGRVEPERWVLSEGPDAEHQQSVPPPSAPERVIDPRVCAVLTDILKDPAARYASFGASGPLNLPFECAVKTGTSKDFRDNWTVGYTPRFVVGVWVGNFNGLPMHGVSGVTGAAPVFRDVMLALARREGGSPRFVDLPGLVRLKICEASGQLPGPDCHNTCSEVFLQERAPSKICQVHRRFDFDCRTNQLASASCPARYRQSRVLALYPPLYRDWMRRQNMPVPTLAVDSAPVRIAFPDSGSIYKIDPVLRREFQRIRLKPVVPAETGAVVWEVDGKAEPARRDDGYQIWWTLQAGSHQMRVLARGEAGQSLGESAPIRVLVQ